MQQLFSFINLFKSALHVSGDKFFHPQEHSFFGCIYSFWYNAPKLNMQSQMFLRMGEFVARNVLRWFKKINKRKKLLHLVGCLHRYKCILFKLMFQFDF